MSKQHVISTAAFHISEKHSSTTNVHSAFYKFELTKQHANILQLKLKFQL